MASDEELDKEYKRLRAYLNSSVKGETVDDILYGIASAGSHLVNNVEAVNDQMYIISAVDRYLDQRLADSGLVRPGKVGLSDEIFRELGIEVTNRKQVRDLIHKLLQTMYGQEFTNASIKSNLLEPYALQNNDQLFLSLDDGATATITFTTDQFSSIAAATAQEVADAITKGLRKLGLSGNAVAQDDGLGGYVEIISNTSGPSSSIKVLGGRSQNEFKFDLIRPTSGVAATQWTLTELPSGNMRATWSAGPDPSIGKIREGDYVNIFGSAFDSSNKGTFNILEVKGGTVGDAYFEYDNLAGTAETQLQGTSEGMLFFNAARKTLNSKISYAAAYQTEERVLEIFMPATTRVVRRNRAGAAHLHDPTAMGYVPNTGNQNGPYLFDLTKPYTLSDTSAITTTELNSTSNNVFTVDDSSGFPDETGNLVLGYGTSHEEGPIPYIARPSGSSIMASPAYKFKLSHPVGTDVTYISQNNPYVPTKDGTDFPFYITDSVSGRLYAEELINTVAATGIKIVITVLYPNDIGLGKHGTDQSEKVYVWGNDEWPKSLTLNED